MSSYDIEVKIDEETNEQYAEIECDFKSSWGRYWVYSDGSYEGWESGWGNYNESFEGNVSDEDAPYWVTRAYEILVE